MDALRLFFRRFILNDVPMLHKDSVLNAHNICGNPINRQAEIRKSPMDHDEISIGDDRSWLILERRRKTLDEIEQTLPTRCDMSAVLDVVGRPEALGG